MSSIRSSVILGVLVLVASILVYPWLPAEVPIHFDLHGRIDGTAPRAIGAFLLPVITLITIGVVARAARARPPVERGPMGATMLLVTALFAGLQLIVVRAALVGATGAATALGTLLALASLGLALLLPRVRRNRVVGIRTPWTLASDEIWARSHRLGGYLFAAAGVIGLAGVVLGRPEIAILSLVVAGVAATAGSWLVSRQR